MLWFAVAFATTTAYTTAAVSAAYAPRWWAFFLGAVLLLLAAPLLHPKLGHVLFAVFLAYAAASLVWAPTFGGSAYLFELVAAFVIFCAAAEAPTLTPAWLGLVYGIWLQAGLALAQRFGFHPVEAATSMVAGTFWNKDFLAEAAVPALVFCLMTRRWRLAVGPIVAIVIPEARESILALAAAGLLYIAFVWKRFFVAGGLVVISVVLGLLFVQYDGNHITSVDARFIIWQIALANLTPFGHGLGSFATMLPAFEYAHSEPIQFLFELGVGAAAIIILFTTALCAPRGPEANVERTILAAVLAGAFVYFPLHLPVTLMVVAMAAGYCCGAPKLGVAECSGRDKPKAMFRPSLVGIPRDVCVPRVGWKVLPFRLEYPVSSRALPSRPAATNQEP
jgi:hypothetical protein